MKQDCRQLVITCEHGGNRIPPALRGRFASFRALLASHRGYDPGALVLARDFAAQLDAPLFFSETTRLLVELNRSPGHPQLFSIMTRDWPDEERQALLDRYYWPYRDEVERHIAGALAAGGRVVHLSVHTFTPELDGRVRTADVGLLYDPARPRERDLCRRWQAALVAWQPSLRVRRNYPYLGTADGFTTYLRRRNPPSRYAGIELEINQQWVKNRPGWQRLRAGIIRTFAALGC